MLIRGAREFYERTDSLRKGARRGAQLTLRLLAFYRRQSLDPRWLDVNVLVRDMSERLVRSIGSGIALKTVLAAELWRTFADASQLEGALIHLCVNHRDAMPDGGELIVETGGYTRGAPLYDVIADSGGAVLPKPLTVEQLAAKIRSTLDAGKETPVAH